MPDVFPGDRFHCRDCWRRADSPANLTLYDDKLWRPECLSAKAAHESTHQTPAPPAPPHRSDWIIAALGVPAEPVDPDAELRRAIEAEAAQAEHGLRVENVTRGSVPPRRRGVPSRQRRSA